MGYLKPIIDIERVDRDDVFKKSNKFDRSGPDYGQNIPFELISALNSLQLSKDHHIRLSNKSDHDNDNTDELIENDGILGDHKEDETVDSIETTETLDAVESKEPVITTTTTDAAESLIKQTEGSEEKEEHPTKPLWDEFTTRLKHQKSMDEQVIDTRQDRDLEKEMEQNLKNKEHQPEVVKESVQVKEAIQVKEASTPEKEEDKNEEDKKGEDKKGEDKKEEKVVENVEGNIQEKVEVKQELPKDGKVA